MKKLLLLIALLSTASCQSNVGDPTAGSDSPSEITAARSVCLGGSEDAPPGFDTTFDAITAIIISGRNSGITRAEALDALETVCGDSCDETSDAAICDQVCSTCFTAVVDAVY